MYLLLIICCRRMSVQYENESNSTKNKNDIYFKQNESIYYKSGFNTRD